MEYPTDFDQTELREVLAGGVTLCDVTLVQLREESRAWIPLAVIRETLGDLLGFEVTNSTAPLSRTPPGTEAGRVILVVEPDPVVLLAIQVELRRLGHLVIGVQNPEAAARFLECVDHDDVDLVICDLGSSGSSALSGWLTDPRRALVVSSNPVPGLQVLKRPFATRTLRREVGHRLSA